MNRYALSQQVLKSGLLALLLASSVAGAATELPLYGPAYVIADEAYKAYERGDFQTAVTKAREAIRLRPDVVRLKELLAQAETASADKRAAVPDPVKALAVQAKTKPAITKPVKPAATRPTKMSAPEEARSPPGFEPAAVAYKAHARGEYAAAVSAAKRAVWLAPENPAYRRLLVNALASKGQLEEADAAASEALGRFPKDEELTARRMSIRGQLAWLAGAEADQAMARGDQGAAMDAARRAVSYAPGIAFYRVLLLRALIGAGRLQEAQQAASDALKEQKDETLLLVLRAYIRQTLGERAAARADFDQALQRPGMDKRLESSVRYIAADAAMAAGEPQRAQAILALVGEQAAPEAVTRLAAADDAAQRAAAGHGLPVSTLAMPQLNCRISEFAGYDLCEIRPGSAATDPAYKIVESAYRALAKRDYPVALPLIREAVQISPANADFRILLVNTLAAADQSEEADQIAGEALKRQPDDARMLAARGFLRKGMGKPDLATADFKAALSLGDLPQHTRIGILLELDRRPEALELLTLALGKEGIPGLPDADLAYLATRAGNDQAGFAAFERAGSNNTLPENARRDAAFTATRLARNDQAIGFFKQAIDAVEADRLKLKPQELFETRRAVAELSRRWGTYASLSYRGITAPGLGAAQPSGANDSLQAGVEAYWRPFGYRNGRLFEVYGRVSETLSGGDGVRTGSESLQGVVGARVKPFGETNLVIALERSFPLGSQVNQDWLARIGYSSSIGTDLRVDVPSWLTSQLYAEAGHYMQHTQNYFTSEAQLGRSFRLDAIDPKLVLFPHAVLGADYNSTEANDKNALGAGLGVNMRYWFNEDLYRAPSSSLDLSLQYRARIAGDARAKGLFVRMTISY